MRCVRLGEEVGPIFNGHRLTGRWMRRHWKGWKRLCIWQGNHWVRADGQLGKRRAFARAEFREQSCCVSKLRNRIHHQKSCWRLQGLGFTATVGIRWWTNRHRKVRGFWQSCAGNGRRRPGRHRKSAFGWCICDWGLYWVQKAALWRLCGCHSGWAWAGDWVRASSGCRGLGWPIRCARSIS